MYFSPNLANKNDNIFMEYNFVVERKACEKTDSSIRDTKLLKHPNNVTELYASIILCDTALKSHFLRLIVVENGSHN